MPVFRVAIKLQQVRNIYNLKFSTQSRRQSNISQLQISEIIIVQAFVLLCYRKSIENQVIIPLQNFSYLLSYISKACAQQFRIIYYLLFFCIFLSPLLIRILPESQKKTSNARLRCIDKFSKTNLVIRGYKTKLVQLLTIFTRDNAGMPKINGKGKIQWQNVKNDECIVGLGLNPRSSFKFRCFIVYITFQENIINKYKNLYFQIRGTLTRYVQLEIKAATIRFAQKSPVVKPRLDLEQNQGTRSADNLFVGRQFKNEPLPKPYRSFQQPILCGSPGIYLQISFSSLQLNHFTISFQKKREMQANNFYYYPCNNFYGFPQYASVFPYFQPVLDYNSSFQKCQLSELHPVEIISPTVDTTYKLPNEEKPAQTPQIKPKKNKITTTPPKVLKEKHQKNSNKTSKNPKAISTQQKEGRNANSNLLRMFFRRLQNKIQDNSQHIQNIIQKYQMKITLREFAQWIQINKIDHRNYIRVPTIRKFFVEQQFVREHTKIIRILFKHFIDSESINCYLTSKKVRKQAMSHNYKAIREIFQEILAEKP